MPKQLSSFQQSMNMKQDAGTTKRLYSLRMLNKLLFIIFALTFGLQASSSAQKNKIAPSGAPLLTRTISRHEVRRFGHGGTITIVGAPRGSITVQGWQKNEVDISAEIEVQGATEADMARVSAVTGFILDDDANHLSVITTGTHDKVFMKRIAKGFPKQLLSLPWKIDYRLMVPINTDLEINGGVGAIKLADVEGALRLSSPEADATLVLTGRIANVTVGTGTVNVIIPQRSWRGSGADIQLASGQLNVELPIGFSGDIDADILRSGKVENLYPGLETRERAAFTESSVHARAGAGGAYLKFTVGAGSIKLSKSSRN
jgi:hypothetical protein